jgi:glucose-6-phosphate 1-dehydrogenase
MEFAQQGGEGPTPYEVLLHAATQGDSTRFTRRDGVEEAWRVVQPLLAAPPAPSTYTADYVFWKATAEDRTHSLARNGRAARATSACAEPERIRRVRTPSRGARRQRSGPRGV